MLVCGRLILGFVNVLALAFSIFHILFAIIESHGSNRDCNKKLPWMIHWLSVFLFVMSFVGLIASCLKSRVLQSIYLAVAITAAMVAIGFTVFTFAALPKSSANATRQKATDGNWLQEFSPVLRRAVVNDKDWSDTRKCLIDNQTCQRSNNSLLVDLHTAKDPNFLQLGCCVPPKRCGFVPKNGTNWEIPTSGATATDKECLRWANSKDGNCYDCDSCKAGYLAKFQADWRADGGIFIGIGVVLVVAVFLSGLILRTEKIIKDKSQHKEESTSVRSRKRDENLGELSISISSPMVSPAGGRGNSLTNGFSSRNNEQTAS